MENSFTQGDSVGIARLTPSDTGFALSADQQGTADLLERLFGRTIANRYLDFNRLAAGATHLRVSKPLAAHAIRELESMIRTALEVPMDARAPVSATDTKRSDDAASALKKLGYDDNAVQRALKVLEPRLNHTTQIKKIAERLGLAANGDIALAWVSLCNTFGRAHERSFHHSLAVDDEFRDAFQKPFEMVIRGIATALQGRYSILMQRVETIAAMTDIGHAVALYASEIPGALPLQWHFFQNIESANWLPHLKRKGLIGEPSADGGETPGGARFFRDWPAGHYLLRLAKSSDPAIRLKVVDAIRAVAPSKHPDVRQQSLDIIAVLPATEAALLVDETVNWLDADARNTYQPAPEKIVKHLSQAGETSAALKVARALFQLFDDGGSIATLHPQHMYEHHLPQAVADLTKADGLAALKLFSDLLLQAATITQKIGSAYGDNSYHTPHPIADNQMASYDVYDALIIAVRDAGLAAASQSEIAAREATSFLLGYQPRIFKRLGLHILSKHASAASNLAASLLTSDDLVGESWCEDEYAELALTWFPSLEPAQQNTIFGIIDAMPGQYEAAWEGHFEAQQRRVPNEDDRRIFKESVVRDAVWKWKDVLPASRKASIQKIVNELGSPDDWQSRIFPPEVSPLTSNDFTARPVREIVALLKEWRPQESPVKQTVTALAQQLRTAVEQEAARYADEADSFVGLRPIYVRRILEGLDNAVRNKRAIPWEGVLKLIKIIIDRIDNSISASNAVTGDDENWLLACSSASDLLKSGLRLGEAAIPYEHSETAKSSILALVNRVPPGGLPPNFEENFSRHPFFTAHQTLWGSAIELCIHFIFWSARQPSSPFAAHERETLGGLEEIRSALEQALSDSSRDRRISFAVLGRHLHWLFYFGESWLRSNMQMLFPENNEDLRRAAWLGHLLNDSGPLLPLMPVLEFSYLDEISRLGNDEGKQDQQTRENRLGDYTMILYIVGGASKEIMTAFWDKAPVRTRQHAMWYLGTQLRLPADKLSDEYRANGTTYWNSRLAAGVASANKDWFRKELGAIGQWCGLDGIDRNWLMEQLLILLNAGFSPNSGYSVVDWLAKTVAVQPDKSVEILLALLKSPQLEHSTYATHRTAVHAVLLAGLEKGSLVTADRAREIISILASMAETSHLELIRPDVTSQAQATVS